jgi:hypothetical protein
MKIRIATAVLAALLNSGVGALAADFPNVRDESYTERNGSRVIKLKIAVNAPSSKIWNLLSNAEGWKSWAVPVAWVEFGVGGTIETSYSPTAVRGNPSNIKNLIVAYVPEQLLVLRNVQAPPDFKNAEEFAQTVTVISLRPTSKNSAQVELDAVGYLPTPAFDALLKMFRYGDSWTLQQLKHAAEVGPMDWSAEAKTDPPKQSK